jgi:UDP-N-acetylmuramoyl-tripeptide--D-alanyl-D-alanine ligase
MAHLIDILTQQLSEKQPDIAILVKGSRSAHMEHVVTDIMQWFEQMNTKQDVSLNGDNNKQNKEGMA